MSTAYAAHAELCTAIHANEDVDMLTDMHEIFPHLNAYLISGDMFAVAKRGTPHQRKARRKKATEQRVSK